VSINSAGGGASRGLGRGGKTLESLSCCLGGAGGKASGARGERGCTVAGRGYLRAGRLEPTYDDNPQRLIVGCCRAGVVLAR
jgi:hypothetical protein